MMDAIHGTIAVADTAEVYDLDADYAVVLIVNEEAGGNTAPIYATVGSADDDPAVPVANARGTIEVRPGERFAVRPISSGATRVRVVCANLEPFSIYGFEQTEYVAP